ncbi:MAG: DNA translocase FtsK [Candidatus Berkelbacteria bacterium]
MKKDDRLDKLEKQLNLLNLKLDIVYSKITDDDRFNSSNVGVEDELYGEAKEIVVLAGKASASLIQRRLRVGYARAARLLDMLEEEGIIGPSEGVMPRNVLVEEKFISGISPENKIDIDPNMQDEFYSDAKKVVIKEGKASSAILQRYLQIGYARAARLLDILESEGVIGPADGAKPRDILVDK